MGLLDDAIREHLELKRQHGADPSEVARQEREALGAAQRAAAEAEAAAAAAQAPQAADAADFDVPEVDVPTPGPAAPPPEPEAIPEPPVTATEPPERVAARAPLADDELDWSGPPSKDPKPEVAEQDEDVLEETPDFLQETPEHDRLWFEQRPPRDFDF
jgi:hypothetical protein